MGLHKLSAGDGYTYLTRQVAAMDATGRGPGTLEAYYSEHGEAPGQWLGSGLSGLGMRPGEPVSEAQMLSLFGQGWRPDGTAPLGRAFKVFEQPAPFRHAVTEAYQTYNTDRGLPAGAPVPVEARARIRTDVAQRLFAEQHARAPLDGRELSGFIAHASRPAQAAVGGFDLTFSPVKSVSVLWALAPLEVARQVESAHRAAVEDTIAWLEREVAFTRSGIGGVRQVPVRGLVAAAFTHRDSRAGDPDLHTHVAVSSKVQTLPEEGGRWLALDGRVLYKAKVAASERYNTRLEAELIARLGVRFTERPAPDGKRAIREIDGISPYLAKHWSSRRREIDRRRAELARNFQADHGRPPTTVEALALAQQATLETRAAKHEPRAEADQRAAWRAEAVDCFGDTEHIDRMLNASLGHPTTARQVSNSWVTTTAEHVVATMEESRATWQVWHVRAETERQARASGIGIEQLDNAVDRVVAHALEVCSVRLGSPEPLKEPPSLQRPDGASVYDVHGSASYTSERILAAEHSLLATAHLGNGRSVNPARVDIALVEAAANGTVLDDAQAALVRELASSGRRLQLALAPAGTGKTTAMKVLAAAWHDADGDVVGLAPSASAAHELADATRLRADTLAKLTHALRSEPTAHWPPWMTRIGPRTLVIVDEAGQAGTADLAQAVDFIVGRGGSVRLIGDDQQLAAVAAGGVLRDLDHNVGAVHLSVLHRFTDPGEAAATLALRDGDPTALGFYADHHRIHVGDTATAADQAYAAWAADRAAGRDTVLLAPTRDLVRLLNERARVDRLDDLGPHRSPAGEVDLGDGTRASAGDVIITRRNDRRLHVTGTDWVKNGDRWTVLDSPREGSLVVRHRRHGHTVTLPLAYVAEHVQLGYATTVHGAQGMTADTCHTVLTGQENRQLLYVGLTRGRLTNHVYLAAAPDGDPKSPLLPEALTPPTAIDVLTRILATDGSQKSATTRLRELEEPGVQLHQAVLRYQDALATAAETALGPQWRNDLDEYAEYVIAGLTQTPAYPTLLSRLALRALDGGDPYLLLREACRHRDLDTAHDPAAVIDHRLGPTTTGPLPWLPAVPTALTTGKWGDYLNQRAQLVTDLASEVRSRADHGAPSWTQQLGGPKHAQLRGDIAVWRASYAIAETESRPTGAPVLGAGRTHHHDLDHRLYAATRDAPGVMSWSTCLPPEVLVDPHRGALDYRLDQLKRAGADVPGLLVRALQASPLPTEVPADALWWRVTHLHQQQAATRPELARRPSPTPVHRAPTTKHPTPHRPTYDQDRRRRLGPAR